MPISVRDYLRLSSAGGLGGAGGGVTLTQVQTEATTAATAVKTELSDADTAGKGANLISYTKLAGETGVVAPQYDVGDVRRYGGVGNNASRPLSTVYGSLADAQSVYPHATALTDEIDWCAIQAAINNASALGTRQVWMPRNDRWIINRPLLGKSGVVVDGNGAYIKSTASNAQSVQNYVWLCGNFHLAFYDSMPSYALANISAGDKQITFSTPAQAGNLSVGVPFIIRSTSHYIPANGYQNPYFHEAAIPTDINVASGVVKLEYPIQEAVTSPLAVPFDGTTDTVANAPKLAVKDFHLKNMIVEPGTNTGWCQRWGMVYCSFENIEVVGSLGILVGNMASRCRFEKIRGVFSDRALEVKSMSHHTIIRDVECRYESSGAALTVLVDIGEASHSVDMSNIIVHGGNWNGTSVLRFDSYDVALRNSQIFAPAAIGAAVELLSKSDAIQLRNNTMDAVTLYLGGGTRYLRLGVLGTTTNMHSSFLARNCRFQGAVSQAQSIQLEEGRDCRFIGCDFENGYVSRANNTRDITFDNCKIKGRELNIAPSNFTANRWRNNIVGEWADAQKVAVRGYGITGINSTTANNVVSSLVIPGGSTIRPQDGDMVTVMVRCNVSGTTGAKTIAVADNTGVMHTASLAAGDTGIVAVDATIKFGGNTSYVYMGNVVLPNGTSNQSRISRTGLNIFSAGRTISIQGWVANAADSIDFDLIEIIPKPLIAGVG